MSGVVFEVADEAGKVMFRLNRALPLGVAVRIIQIINEADEAERHSEQLAAAGAE